MFKGDRLWLQRAVRAFKTAVLLPFNFLFSDSAWRARAYRYSYCYPYSA